MAQQHLQDLFSSNPDIRRDSKTLQKEYGIDISYFWDEATLPHLGAGWVAEFTILGVSIGAGIAASSFLKSYFEKAGEAAWQSTIALFENIAKKLGRKRMFFFVAAPLQHIRITLLLDERILADKNLLLQSYILYGKLIQLAERNDELITAYFKGPLLIKYDNRCNDFVILPCGFEIESESGPPLFTSQYAWVLADQPDERAKPFARLDNLFLIRAIFHRSLAEYTESFTYFEKALAKNSGNASVYLEMGATHFRQGNFQTAIDYWEKVEQFPGILTPGQGIEDIYIGYCQLLRERGDEKGADAALRLGMVRLPARRLAKLYIENSRVLRAREQIDEALGILKEGLERVPKDSKDYSCLNSEYGSLLGSANGVSMTLKPRSTQPSKSSPMIKVLFLTANPSDTTRLRLNKEIREIDLALRQTAFRDRFVIEQHWAVRVTDLQGYLLRHQPDIVHFSGHGDQSSEIILEDDLGDSQSVSTHALNNLFSVLKDNIRCVILNACYSEQQARVIAENIDCVIGMSKAISDSAAISFAVAFYQALGYGRDLKTAFELGCNQIELAHLDQQNIPKLLASRGDPGEIVFVHND